MQGSATSPATIAVMMPGDMGSAVAARLKEAGHRVLSCVEGRSERTRKLAAEAGIELTPSLDELVAHSDLVLSILVPSAAGAFAQSLAGPIARQGRPVTLVDLNAIAPATAKAIESVVRPAGGVVVDGGIIGPPPRGSASTRFYLSGEGCERVAAVLSPALDARALGGGIGDASALKMCYAASTKGSAALGIQLMVAAERLGVRDHLEAEFAISRSAEFESLKSWIPAAVPKAFRWIGEMEEIADTFNSVGVSPLGFQGAAQTYRAVAASPLGSMRVEEWTAAGMDFDAVMAALARAG